MNSLQQKMYDRLWDQFMNGDYELIYTAKEFILKGMSEDDVRECVRVFSENTAKYGVDDERMREVLFDFVDAVLDTGPAWYRLFDYEGPHWKDG